MVGRQETSGRGALQDSRRARLVPVTVMKSPSSFEVSVEVFSSGMSISNTNNRSGGDRRVDNRSDDRRVGDRRVGGDRSNRIDDRRGGDRQGNSRGGYSSKQ